MFHATCALARAILQAISRPPPTSAGVMAVVLRGSRDADTLPNYLVTGAAQRAAACFEEFGHYPPRQLETLYTITRLKKDFATGLGWMRGAFRHAPDFQIDMLGYFLYARGVEAGVTGTPELCATRCLLQLPWPAQALGDDTCALDLLPRLRLALEDAPPAGKRRRGDGGPAAVGS